MYWATKNTNGHIVVQTYNNVQQIKEAYSDMSIAKIIMPFEAPSIKEAGIEVGNLLERGKFIMMEQQKNGRELPKRYF